MFALIHRLIASHQHSNRIPGILRADVGVGVGVDAGAGAGAGARADVLAEAVRRHQAEAAAPKYVHAAPHRVLRNQEGVIVLRVII